MFVAFLYELRRRGVPVGPKEAVALAEALARGLHESSLEGFYYVSRALLVHREAHLDDFDQAFSAHFRGVEVTVKELREELYEWLEATRARARELSDEERQLVESMDLQALRELFEQRMAEQDGRHDGGNHFIGTAGTSPFGHGGAAPKGIRLAGAGGLRSAVKVADARAYAGYRQDLTLDVRQMQVALRKLRAFAREGSQEELDMDATLDATAKNAGEIEVVTRPPRRSSTRLILMMDVGGSMDPYAHLVSRLFTAAKKSTHFKELRTYYFHNCVYGQVYATERFDEPIRLRDLLRECGPHYKLIMLGDALMAPYELMASGGSLALGDDGGVEGIVWLMTLADHFDRVAWLNPEPAPHWTGNTIEHVARVFPMYPLTLDGLEEAVRHLVRGGRKG